MLEKLLTKEDCAKCRLCCKFDSYDLWQTPVIYRSLASRILQEYSPKIKFVKRDEHFLMKMDKEEGADVYFCPLLDHEKGCIMGDEKPFDCEIWPFMVMELCGRKVLTLSPACPVVNSLKFDDVCVTAAEIAPGAFAMADEHPELVRPYLEDHPILAVEKSRYKTTLV
ncbi:hypothetical protein [Ruminococcus sp. NK3A76]|uniref:hypothetical protein n=1 Tax=Ruminococcus sp. NK3A76 TaxID=877411 RepID=UPI00048F8CC5|nr:hypothetical protein [Ruminococcus sp. NK3A76]